MGRLGNKMFNSSSIDSIRSLWIKSSLKLKCMRLKRSDVVKHCFVLMWILSAPHRVWSWHQHLEFKHFHLIQIKTFLLKKVRKISIVFWWKLCLAWYGNLSLPCNTNKTVIARCKLKHVRYKHTLARHILRIAWSNHNLFQEKKQKYLWDINSEFRLWIVNFSLIVKI